MSDLVLEPNPKQLQFLREKHRHVSFGGARGGGKSWVVRVKACLLCNRWPGIKVLIVRRTLQELRNNHIDPLKIMLAGMSRYNQQEKRFSFRNGSSISFGYCDNDNDLLQYQGAEYDVIFIDEATQLQEDWIKKIVTSCRGTGNCPRRVYYTMNPGGPSHQYFKSRFIDRVFPETENPDDYVFIQALVTDNRVLMDNDPEYVNFLKALPPKLRKAWLEGDWNMYEGQYFEEFRNDPDHYRDRQWTHVIDPITVRKHWSVYRSFDWGYHRPFSMGYYTIDDDGVMYRIAEYYGVQKSGHECIANEGVKWAPDRVFAEIQRFEQEHPLLAGREITGVADPAIWDAESGISYAETAMKYGIYFQPGDHKRIPGWMQCHYRLMFNDDGLPMFYCFSTCREFIRTIPTLQYDQHKAEDLDTSGEDHIADEWRYFCMSRPITPEITEPEKLPMWGADPLDQYGRET